MTDVPSQPHARHRRAVAVAYRVAVGVAGTCVILIGLVLVPLPGPGWPVVFLGFVVLGSEFSWAERIRHIVQRRVSAAVRWSASAAWPVRAALSTATVASILLPSALLAIRL